MPQYPSRLLNYSLLHELGRGGMATVWYAENSVGRKFAIKLLRPDLISQEPSVAERFRNEAQIMVRLEHPAILRVEDFYEDGTTLAIIMEYLSGHDLNQHFRQYGPVAEYQVIMWFLRILDAFSYVHKKGYFHRDIKPANLFLTDSGLIKVMDFGIAKIVGDDLSLTQTGTMMGSPLYMSPEQVDTSKPVDFRTDIYSLGVTLYTLLSGKKPYNDTEKSLFNIQSDIVHQPLPRLENVSDAVNEAIQKATQKDPDKRFASCEDFAKALNEHQVNGTDDDTIIKSGRLKAVSFPSDDEATVLKASVKNVVNAPNNDEAQTTIRPDVKKDEPLFSGKTSQETVEKSVKKPFPIIISIVIGVLLIGTWLYMSGKDSSSSPLTLKTQLAVTNEVESKKINKSPEAEQISADLSRAITFYNQEQYDSAFVLFDRYRNNSLMEANAEAQTDLGIIYFYGASVEGKKPNPAQAEAWLSKGVAARNPKAHYFLGLLKDDSIAGAQAKGKNAEAVNLYKQAADLGDVYAQITLGELYLKNNRFATALDGCQVLAYLKSATQKLPEANNPYQVLKKRLDCPQI